LITSGSGNIRSAVPGAAISSAVIVTASAPGDPKPRSTHWACNVPPADSAWMRNPLTSFADRISPKVSGLDPML
jgi:hypothetical protein